jgi:ArsR family transcriptional regulator
MPKGPKGQKRPTDVIRKAVRIMQIATGEAEEEYEAEEPKNKAAVSTAEFPRLTPRRTFDMSGGMDTSLALAGLSALAQESRLKVFRLLVQCGPEGMAAGDIARKLKVPHNTMSSHLGILSRARLVIARKQSRSIIYSVDLEGTRDFLSFLVEDCCRGKREICQPLIASALAECC